MSPVSTKLISTQFVELPIDSLTVDASYQRVISDAFVAKAVKNFNINLVRFPLVNLRADGTYHVFDGQHTVKILRTVGYTTVMVRLYTGMTPIEEAEMWKAGFNQHAATPYDQHRVGLLVGDPVDIGIRDTCANFRVTLNGVKGKAPRVITAITVLKKIYLLTAATPPYDVPAGKVLSSVLQVSTSCWENNSKCFENTLLDGWLTVARHNVHIMSTPEWIARANEVFSIYAPDDILNFARAKTRTARLSGQDVARVLFEKYNKGNGTTISSLAPRDGRRMREMPANLSTED